MGRPLIHEIDSVDSIGSQPHAAFPRTLRIVLGTNASDPAGILVINAGAVRFNLIASSDVVPVNAIDEIASEPDSRRELFLNLRLHYVLSGQQFIFSGELIDAASLAALASVRLATETGDFSGDTTFGVAADNAKTELTQPIADGNTLPNDLWFTSDLSAELTDRVFISGPAATESEIQRLAYQSWALFPPPTS